MISVYGPMNVRVASTFQKVGMVQLRAGNVESGRLFVHLSVRICRQGEIDSTIWIWIECGNSQFRHWHILQARGNLSFYGPMHMKSVEKRDHWVQNRSSPGSGRNTVIYYKIIFVYVSSKISSKYPLVGWNLWILIITWHIDPSSALISIHRALPRDGRPPRAHWSFMNGCPQRGRQFTACTRQCVW